MSSVYPALSSLAVEIIVVNLQTRGNGNRKHTQFSDGLPLTMNSEIDNTHNTPVATLLNENIGPHNDCREKLWSALVDFAYWPQRISALQAVVVSDANDLGRGSQLQLDWIDGMQLATVSYWHPGQKLELVFDDQQREVGLRFVLNDGKDAKHIELLVEYEVAEGNSWPILDRLLKRRSSNALKARIRDLVSSFHKLS